MKLPILILAFVLVVSACDRSGCRVARDCPDPATFCSTFYGQCIPVPVSGDTGSDAFVEADSSMPDAGLDAGLDAPLDGGFDETCVENSCYWLVSVASWTDADAACGGRGGHLATVSSPAEQALVWTTAMPAMMPAWIGATDAGTEGSWRWTTGEPFDPIWGATQPDNAGGAEHCAVIWPDFDGAWADVACESMFPAICEREI